MSGLRIEDLELTVPGRVLLQSGDLAVAEGEVVAVTGRSGSGKTSLLHCLAGITRPSAGAVWIGEDRLDVLSVHARAAVRLRRIGMVFQFAELLPELNVLDNVTLPARLAGRGEDDARNRACKLLTELGLAGKERQPATVLSGGEAQRVAIARAMVNTPNVVLADEPTGALDEENAQAVGMTLARLAREHGAAVIIATHDGALADLADRRVALTKGELVAA